MSGVFWNVTRSEVRRAMSLQDFNPASATYGCCDRSFWQYRTISSFPAATMQQVALPFAVLFESPFPGNGWYQHGEMFERARAAMLFWARSQHASGAVDEWYRNEHSYCATAFTTFGITEACLRLQSQLVEADRDEISRAVRRSARWLGERFNDEVMNQNLAASAALWNAHQLTGDVRCKAAYEKTWNRTRGRQDDEGWFEEYGGADLGYSLLALDLLAALDRRGSPDAAGAAASLTRFVALFAVGESDLAGRLGSRGTEHSFPFGAEAFARALPAARVVAAHLRAGIEAEAVSDPRTVDDRYLAYFYLPSFVMASSLGHQEIRSDTVAESTALAHSGFRVWRKPGGDIVCSMRRNAAFNLYAPGRPVHRNLGYWIEATNGRKFASCAWSTNAVNAQERDDGVRVEGEFFRLDDRLPLVRHEVAFRAVTRWLFRWPFMAEPFHRFIKSRKITRRVAGPLTFARELTWSSCGVVVRDVLRAHSSTPRLSTVMPAADVDVHSPSARQSGSSPNDVILVTRELAERWAEQINNRGELVLLTSYEPDASGRLKFVAIREQPQHPS